MPESERKRYWLAGSGRMLRYVNQPILFSFEVPSVCGARRVCCADRGSGVVNKDNAILPDIAPARQKLLRLSTL